MATITTTASQAEIDCRAFAQQFPTSSVLEALAYCESGRLAWEKVAALFARSLAAGMAS